MSDNKKLPSSFFNMVMVLSVISLISALALGITYTGTKDAIAQVEVKRTIKALKDVLPEFDNDPNAEKYEVAVANAATETEEFQNVDIYPAKKAGVLVGNAVRTYTKKSFGDPFWLMVGFDKDNKINKIAVLSQKETPGLGTKIEDARFKDQFSGKDPATFKMLVKKDTGDVDAISAATISSRAFCDAVQRAADALKGGTK